MPRLRPCAQPGCGALVPQGGPSRCPEHVLPSAARFAQHRGILDYMSGYAWGRLRLSILDRDGHRCTSCGTPCPHPRHHPVDHIQNLARGGSPDDPANLRTLCKPEHDAKTGRESRSR